MLTFEERIRYENEKWSRTKDIRKETEEYIREIWKERICSKCVHRIDGKRKVRCKMSRHQLGDYGCGSFDTERRIG